MTTLSIIAILVLGVIGNAFAGTDGIAGVPAELTNGLVAYYPFNGNANDASGNGIDLVNTSGLSFVSDSSRSALRMSTSSRAESSLNAGISGNVSRSISFWFRSNGPQPWLQGYVIGVGAQGNRYSGDWTYISIDSSKGGNFSGNTGGVMEPGGIIFVDNYYRNVWSDVVPNLHQTWHHVVWTYQNNLGSSKIFIDGKLFPSFPEQSGTTQLITPDGPIHLGRLDGGWPDGIGFQGLLDSVGIWKRALTDAEVLALYRAQSPVYEVTLTTKSSTNLNEWTSVLTNKIETYNPTEFYKHDISVTIKTPAQ